MQETRWESKEPSKKESASLDLELRRHRMSGPSAVRRKSILRTFLGAARGLWSTPRPGKGACSAATLEPAIHVLAPTDVDAFVHGWRVSAHLEHRQLLEEARLGPDLLAGCGSKKQRLALGVGAVRWREHCLPRRTVSRASVELIRREYITGYTAIERKKGRRQTFLIGTDGRNGTSGQGTHSMKPLWSRCVRARRLRGRGRRRRL